MKRYLSFCMLGIATMLASCSQNEELLQGVDNNNSNTVTFSVALDEGMKTRAFTADPAVSTMDLRAILLEEPATEEGEPTSKEITAITPNGDGTFAVTVSGMMTNSKYKLVLWADNGSDYTVENNVATPANTSKPGIAFYGTSGEYQTPDELLAKASNTLELKHAVAKVTLNTTTELTDGKIATLSVPTRISFNLISGEATGDGTAIDTSEDVTSGNLCSVYVLCNDDDELPTATISLSNGQEKEIASLPMKRNNHIKLQGDVDGIRTAGSLDFKVYLDEKWNETDKIFLPAEVDETTHTITTYIAGQIAEKPTLITEAMDGSGIIKVVGPMDQDDMDAISANKNTITELDLSEATGADVTITFQAFLQSTSLTKIKLGSNITKIDINAFVMCKNLTEVDLSGCTNLEIIEEQTFGASGITSLKLPENGKLSFIGGNAFASNKNLQTVSIPATIESLWDGLFLGCNSLTTIIFKGTEPPIMVNNTNTATFADCVETGDSDNIIYLPNVAAANDAWTDFFGGANGWTVKYGESPEAANP